ncbi:hypothetical protein FB459_1878 [Yimella lutea]|uniref:Uncharacterized protein n=1 Tax=Yimella lutea TaxID=587872 RepID=A0A542EGG9_9MICO|nr:hypothetical protein [Yimella lutea]TQJ14418.1 hypothetical protein FB459_1878 [Yimella lutea]
MTTVDPSGALHDAKGRFAGHIAAESTGDLDVTEQPSVTSARRLHAIFDEAYVAFAQNSR